MAVGDPGPAADRCQRTFVPARAAGYPCIPVTVKFQDCTGQKVVLLAMTYGELSTMAPLQAFHAPLLTAP